VAVVAQARDLPQAQLPLEEAHRLIMQVIAHPAPVELGGGGARSAAGETPLALAIGEMSNASSLWTTFGLHPPRVETMVARRCRSRRALLEQMGKSLVNAG